MPEVPSALTGRALHHLLRGMAEKRAVRVLTTDPYGWGRNGSTHVGVPIGLEAGPGSTYLVLQDARGRAERVMVGAVKDVVLG